MVDFRRWITVIAVFALFAGLACAQVNSSSAGTGSLVCNATVSVPPQLRSEGLTELVGDILLTCSGGAPIAPGATVPTANITVSLPTQVTSRLIGNASTTAASEALLLIDEPGAAPSTALGVGPTLGQTPCGTGVAGGAAGFPGVGAGPGGCVQAVDATGQTKTCTAFTGATCTTFLAGANVFQGLVNSNQVTFNGVPINPPVSAGIARVFRITNVRANVAAVGGGPFAGTTSLQASISISGSTSLPINNPVQTVGFIQAGLATGVRNIRNDSDASSGTSIAQCAGASTTALAVLRFTENFGTAFKTRVSPASNTGGSGQAGIGVVTQNTPGAIFNSESGFVSPGFLTTGNTQAGLADYGTRLKAVFSNVPAGVRIFVSTTNVFNTNSANPAQPAGTITTTTFAQLVVSETAPDSNGFVPQLLGTGTVNGSNVATSIAEIPVNPSTNSAVAVWEIVNTNPSALESVYFGVWTTFTANPGSNQPTPGTSSVLLSYAPTPTSAGVTNFTSTQATTAQGPTVPIPRFADKTDAPVPILVIATCNTALLYPFVSNQGPFDSGLAISNTTSDPFGTRTQTGGCELSFWGQNPPAANFKTGTVAPGTTWASPLSSIAPNFQGYVIAKCDFQLAHGYASISDTGVRNFLASYLALVLPTGYGNRNSGSLVNGTAQNNAVEGVAH